MVEQTGDYGFTQKDYDEAMQSVYEYESEIFEHNNAFLEKHGATAESDFELLVQDCSITGKIEFTTKPQGQKQNEDYYGIFKDVHIDQWSVGDSGDSFAGVIYARVGDQWILIPYSC